MHSLEKNCWQSTIHQTLKILWKLLESALCHYVHYVTAKNLGSIEHQKKFTDVFEHSTGKTKKYNVAGTNQSYFLSYQNTSFSFGSKWQYTQKLINFEILCISKI